MTEEDIVQIESAFAVRLPNGYRQLLKSPPTLLVALMDALAAEHSHFEVPVFLGADAIIDQNLEVRDPDSGFVAGPEEDDKWDDKLLIIGSDIGCWQRLLHQARIWFVMRVRMRSFRCL